MGVTSEHSAVSPIAASAGAASLDADQMNAALFPLRVLPDKVKGRSKQFQVVFDQDTVDAIRAHSAASPQAEVCGVLVGNVYRDGAGPYCYVKAHIRGDNDPARNAQVTFTSETWTHIHQQMDALFPHDRILGWYHSHPTFGIFLSEMDRFIQNNFFNEPWQIAYVDDPIGGDRGVFVWENGTAVRREYLLEPKLEPASPDLQPSQNPVGEQTKQDATPLVGPDRRRQKWGDQLEISARIRLLERQVRSQRRRSRVAMFVALVWPVMLLAGLTWEGVIPAEKLRNLEPVKWTFAKWAELSDAIHANH